MEYNNSLTANSSQGLGFNTISGTFVARDTLRVKPDVDYSDFANHVTFSSAVRKTQAALTFIADHYPLGRTDGYYGSVDFLAADSLIKELDDFATSASDYELYLVRQLGDPNETGHPTITSNVTANFNLSTSAVYPIVNIERNELMQFTNTEQAAFISEQLQTASAYDTGRYKRKVKDRTGTASIANIGKQTFASTTSVAVNRENMLFNLMPTSYTQQDEVEALPRFAQVLGETLDDLKSYIDNMPNLMRTGYKGKGVPRGAGQALLAKMMGYEMIDENLRQDLEKAFLKSSVTSDTSVLDVVEELQERVLNNLQYMYKCKGTRHSIEGLVASYGIPRSIVAFKEYVSKSNNSFITRESTEERFVLDYSNNSTSADRLVAQQGEPKVFSWNAPHFTTEVSIKYNASANAISRTNKETFISMRDRALAHRIDLYTTSGAIGAIMDNNGISAQIETPQSSSARVRHALSSNYVHVSLCAASDGGIVLNTLFPEVKQGAEFLSCVSAVSAGSVGNISFGANDNSVCVFGGKVTNTFLNPLRDSNVSNLFHGKMREFRLFNKPLAYGDLTAHAVSINSITLAETHRTNPTFSSHQLYGALTKETDVGTYTISNPSTNLLYRFPLKDNLQPDVSLSSNTEPSQFGHNATFHATGLAINVISTTGVSMPVHSFEPETPVFQTLYKSGIVDNIRKFSTSANKQQSVIDSGLISLVSSPIDVINNNIFDEFNGFDDGFLFGTPSGLYNSTEYPRANEMASRWIDTWSITGDHLDQNKSLMFDGIKNYQKALENLQDVLLSVLDSAKQFVPAHSHYWEKGMLIAPHALNPSKQERTKAALTAVDVLANVSNNTNSITSEHTGLQSSDVTYNHDPRAMSTVLVKSQAPSLCGQLTDGFSIAQDRLTSFGRVQTPIKFQPSFPDQTELRMIFDRTILSPTGQASIASGTIQLQCKGTRIRTTDNVVRIHQPLFGSGENFGRSQLVISVDGVTLPRNASFFDAPVSNEDGINLVIQPSSEYIFFLINTLPSTEEPISEADLEFSVTNLLDDNTSIQIFTFSIGV